MNHCVLHIIAFFCCVIAARNNTCAQSVNGGENPKQAIYRNVLYPQFPIFSGIQYAWPTSHFENGHIYYTTTQFDRGSITYEGITFTDVDLLLDEAKDEVITFNLARNELIQLFKARIQEFTIHRTKFVNLGPELGFCQVLYNGPSIVFKKEVKKIIEKPVINKMLYFVKVEPKYYISVDDIRHEVTDRKSLLDILTRKEEIKTFMKKNKLNFKKNKEAVIVEIAKHHDSLLK